MAASGDIILLAGKGHETGPDHRRRQGPARASVRRRARRARVRGMSVLWTSDEIAGRDRRDCQRQLRGDRRHLRQPRSRAGRPVRRHAGHRPRRPPVRRRRACRRRGGRAGVAAGRRPACAGRGHRRARSKRLAAPAASARRRRIIGVTGSVGKTSTKEALFAALDRCCPGKVHRSVKSYNNHTGVPLSLARMPRDAEFAVLEMGMNNAGEIAALTRHGAAASSRWSPPSPRRTSKTSARWKRSPTPRARSSKGWSRTASRSSPTTRPHRDRLVTRRAAPCRADHHLRHRRCRRPRGPRGPRRPGRKPDHRRAAGARGRPSPSPSAATIGCRTRWRCWPTVEALGADVARRRRWRWPTLAG